MEKSKTAGLTWALESNGGDRFVLNQLNQPGPKEIFAIYFSYWVYCPIDLSDLLNSGPDLPKMSQHCYVSDTAKLYLNGHLLKPAASTPADYRTRQTYQDLPLKQGWNHFLIKVASDSYHNADPGTLAVRLFSTNRSFEGQLKTSVQGPASSSK